jgi:hypothetical protein
MKNLSFALGTAYTALLAFAIVCVDQLLKGFMPIGAEQGFTYISFIAWATYFFSGCTLKGGIKAAIAYVLGISLSIVIILLAGVFSSLGFFAVPLAVFFIASLALCFEKIPWMDLVPALFIASGCYFGIMNFVPEATFGTAAFVEIVYGFIGLIFGWITVTGKSIIFKAFEKKQ